MKKNLQKNMSCEFNNNAFVGECTKKAVNIYEKIYGANALPSSVDYTVIPGNTYGCYDPSFEGIFINSCLDCFKDKTLLEKEMKQAKNVFFLPDKKSTTHYLRTFIHEFGHRAHDNNLTMNGNRSSWLAFKLGEYSAQDMLEFMSERMSKDICSKLDSNDIYRLLYATSLER